MHSRWEQGNLVFWDTHRHRIVDVIGPNVIYRFANFGNVVQPNTIDPDGWTTTVVEAGAGTSEIDPSATQDVIATIVTAANENDGAQSQAPGAAFKCVSGIRFYLGLLFQTADPTECDLLFGACITDTTLLGGMSDGTYMEKLDAAALVSGVTEKDSSEEQTDSLGTLVASTDMYWEMFFDGTSVHFYVDGVLAASHSTTLCDDEMLRLSIAFLAGEAAAKTLSIKRLAGFVWT